MKRLILALIMWSVAVSVSASINAYSFNSPAQEQRFRHLTEELRCPRCQNESLAGSQAPVARDLKDRVYLMVQSGKSDQQIIDFLVVRYGDFVIYRPPFRLRTAILWVGPWVLAVSVVLMLVLRIGRRNKPVPQLSPEERQRLAVILAPSVKTPM